MRGSVHAIVVPSRQFLLTDGVESGNMEGSIFMQEAES